MYVCNVSSLFKNFNLAKVDPANSQQMRSTGPIPYSLFASLVYRDIYV